ncbi:hypothetical protein BH10PLA2_BH10PLA2_07920 [soil metagenome]
MRVKLYRFLKTHRGPVGIVCGILLLAIMAMHERPLPAEQDPVPARWKTSLMPPKEGLQHADPGIRKAIVADLALRKPEAIPLIPLLIAALDDSEASVRYQAAITLGTLGPVARSAILPLIARLNDAGEKDRTSYAIALGGFGAEAKVAVPALIAALKSNDSTLGQPVLKTLAAVGPAAEPAVPELINALKNQDEATVALALEALGAIGPGARTAVPALMTIAFEKRKSNRHRLRMLEDRIPYEAVVVLGKIGPDAEAALPRLMNVIADRTHYLIHPAIDALGEIGPAAEAAVPTLTALAFDLAPGNSVRKPAAHAIFSINPLLAEQLNLESAFLDVHLKKMPTIKVRPREFNREASRKLVKSLIRELPEIEQYGELGYADSWDRGRFAPLSDYYFQNAGMVFGGGTQLYLGRRYDPKPSAAFSRLVELGPVALPFLLESLGLNTPTNLPPTPTIIESGGSRLRTWTDINPVNPLEERDPPPVPQQWSSPTHVIESHAIKVGDICFAAIEQIVGREFLFEGRALPCSIADGSSIASRKMRERLRGLWGGENPSSRLFESLLADFSTRGISQKGIQEESWIQTNAATRLLYYFPRESAELIATRLEALDVQLPHNLFSTSGVSRDEINGVQTFSFIRAVAWCKEPVVQKSLRDIAALTNDSSIQLLLSER